MALTWVNGINYTSAEVEEQAHFLSTLFGCRVRACVYTASACFTHWLLHKHGSQPTTTIRHVLTCLLLRLSIKSSHKQVRPYYNPSLGGWLRDLTRVSYMYIRAPTEDPVVTGLAKHLSMVRVSWPCARMLPPIRRPICPLKPTEYADFVPSTPAPPQPPPFPTNRCYARSGRGAALSTWRTAGGRC